MISYLFDRRLSAFEKAFDYDASYMRELFATSPRAAMRVARLDDLTSFRRGVPVDVWYAAKLVAGLHGDCGPCAQLGVNMALASGVAPETVRHVVSGAWEELPEDVRLSVRFARAVMARSIDADEHRQRLEARFGKIGVVSLAFGMVGTLAYPTLKYALGHGHACHALSVSGVVVQSAKVKQLVEEAAYLEPSA